MFRILLFALINTLFFSCSAEKEFSTLLRELAELPETDRQEVIDNWIMQRTSFPVIEDSVVYFLYRNAVDIPVFLTGDFNSWSGQGRPFLKIIGTDLYYNRQVFPIDARVEYKLIVGKEWQLDSLNANTSEGGYGLNSLVFMPDYRFPLETLRHRHQLYTVPDTMRYRVGGKEYRTYVYHHPSAGLESPLLIFNDGGDYIRFGQATVVLDNLTETQRIPPVNALFVDPVDRMKEYWINAPYLERLLEGVLPAVKEQNHWQPEKIYMGGVSLGGLTALYALKKYSSELDGIFSQSGSFWVDSLRIVDELKTADMTGKSVFVSYGSFENQDKRQQAVINLLKQKKVRLKIRTIHDGHNWGNWSGVLDDALIFLLSAKEEKNGI